MQVKLNTEKSYISILGKLIKKHRQSLKKSIYQISAESSMAKSNWRELELGLRNDINLSTFCKIAEVLNLQPDELLKELTDKLSKDFSFIDFS